MEPYTSKTVSCLGVHSWRGKAVMVVGLIWPSSGNRGELSMHNVCALSTSHHDCTDIVCSSTRILLPSLVSSAAIEVFQPASSSRLRYLSKVSLCIRSVSLMIMRVALASRLTLRVVASEQACATRRAWLQAFNCETVVDRSFKAILAVWLAG